MISEIFRIFLRLGLTSFGGPVAHIGYFRNEFVDRRKWMDEQSFADLVGLCQFLPGPASSQTGFAIGLMRGGTLGGLAAWLGFTMPSALLLIAFALFSGTVESPMGLAVLHGLKIVAVAVVAQAVWSMARKLCPDWQRSGIAAAAIAGTLCLSSAYTQILVIVLGGLAGLVLCRKKETSFSGNLAVTLSRRTAICCLLILLALFAGLPFAAQVFDNHALAVAGAFYRTGALVFGGGHVVLPLLQAEVVQTGWIDDAHFLAGYGAAQAVPGPLFTFAAYLGAAMRDAPNGAAGAVLCLVAIFLPGLLLVAGMLPFWDAFRNRMAAQAAMRGVNASVVGLLAAALYTPLWTGTIANSADLTIAFAGFLMLVATGTPPWVVVAVSVCATLLWSL